MVMQRFEPVVRESTPSIIAGKLRHAIGRGQIPPGAQLGEAELARELGVSRGPLREAMQRLTQEGLLISIRNRGLFVITMTDEEVRDMYVARTAVERAAAELILQKGTASIAARLRDVVKDMKKAADKGDLDAMSEADMEYHEALVSAAESPRLTRMHNTLLTETRMCLTALEKKYPDPETRVAEHAAIADALAQGDTELVGKLLVSHMEDALQRLTPGADTPPN
ncbi:GntR family transcriptional regulator [Pseudarthrobacter sp. J75]|uniref:GntR family transcriptional regulator n=2 Tax=unclassified Pseudarthrobacter TaxID=2647000 RepID=UPI002E80DF0C|nr:GntR family transcriptional regulator [Pseudarthrobacter sp. J75]MEE2523289.1 GntR family transcriptional regulator [Pseudarthrobacter sp. J47]MEE2527544.1 GntR family transcriptional regulator [Pseudarthrobacter sp. J75]